MECREVEGLLDAYLDGELARVGRGGGHGRVADRLRLDSQVGPGPADPGLRRRRRTGGRQQSRAGVDGGAPL